MLQQDFGWCSPATAPLLCARGWSCCDTLLNAQTQTVKAHLFIAPQPVHVAPAACIVASNARPKANRPPQGLLVVSLPCSGLLELLQKPQHAGIPAGRADCSESRCKTEVQPAGSPQGPAAALTAAWPVVQQCSPQHVTGSALALTTASPSVQQPGHSGPAAAPAEH